MPRAEHLHPLLLAWQHSDVAGGHGQWFDLDAKAIAGANIELFPNRQNGVLVPHHGPSRLGVHRVAHVIDSVHNIEGIALWKAARSISAQFTSYGFRILTSSHARIKAVLGRAKASIDVLCILWDVVLMDKLESVIAALLRGRSAICNALLKLLKGSHVNFSFRFGGA